jgi:hypothetical protein
MEVKLNLTNSEHKDLISFCNLNDLLVSQVVKDSFTTGFNIERYGLLNADNEVKEKEVIKEVIKYVEVPVVEEKEVIKIEYVEVPVEKIVTKEVIVEKIVEVIKEVPVDRVVEKIVEITKEIPVEKIITKTEYVSDDTQINELLLKIQQLEDTPPKVVEVIKEVPVDRVVIQEKIVETIKEVPVEVIKEVIVEKEVGGVDKSKLDALQATVQKIRADNLEKDRLIKEYEKTIQDIQKFQENKQAVYLSGSNLNKTL